MDAAPRRFFSSIRFFAYQSRLHGFFIKDYCRLSLFSTSPTMNEYAFEGPKLQPNFRDMGRVIVSGYDTSYSLPLEVAKRALEKHFSSCGEITDVAFDDRFAYVYFVGEAAVDKALQLFNGSELDGWKLTVEPFPFPNAKDKIIVSVEGFDTCLSQDDLESALTPLFSI
ncbi:PREDICTED: uncharacterized protein LOC104768649 [Camelina sativa]|uniref:Uncharacterized protein LOC104768649 n=1 Tax=Camelina sativa TaxID=90675 RepID=A0ABM0XTW1_CAMSA|nr:PREDICTED: uncharacterized protein LOC104768649 [Camelina sativa]